MLTMEEIQAAKRTPPPVPLDEATVRRVIALRPEATLAERAANAAYLDGLAAQNAALLPSRAVVERLLMFANVREAIEREFAAAGLDE